jgi:chromosome partitioning protein
VLTVVVANTKGGCGKTTTATQLASAFARAGLATALADADRQRSSLGWLERRPLTAAPIRGLDWTKGPAKAPAVDRLVVDAPAALKRGGIEELAEGADVVVVPLLPSAFDEAATAALVAKLAALKPVRKGKKAVAVVANRVKPRSRAAQRLDAFCAELDQPLAGRIADRAAYADLALDGLGVFDLDGARARSWRAEWLSVVAFCEAAA